MKTKSISGTTRLKCNRKCIPCNYRLLKLHIETDVIKTRAELVNAACGTCRPLFIEYIPNKCKKNKVYENGYRRRSCTCKTASIHRFVKFVMYCFITTVLVAFYCARSDEILHYKCDETVIFAFLDVQLTSLITVFINFVFYLLFLFPYTPKLGACNIP